jgi:hypothetical protein
VFTVGGFDVQLSEDLERMITSGRSSSLRGEATTVDIKGSNTASGFDIFEEDKHQVLPEEECVHKGVHENIFMPRPQSQLDIPEVSKSGISVISRILDLY